MSNQQTARPKASPDLTGALLLGTGLAFASLILVPALATQLGIGPSLTGALRIALMKASHKAIRQGFQRRGNRPRLLQLPLRENNSLRQTLPRLDPATPAVILT